MAADVAEFSAAIDKVYGNFSTLEMQMDPKDLKEIGERGKLQYIEQKFQEQLQRARAAFLQEFRNHSVVVEREVRKIREELTEKLEEKYGERIEQLREQNSEANALVQKLRDEVAHLKSLAAAQETYLAAVRHHWAREDKDKLSAEIDHLRQSLEEKTQENAGLQHQLVCRDELVAQLGSELSVLEKEMKREVSDFAQEKRSHDELVRGLRLEMKQQREQFEGRLGAYQEQFDEYRARTTAELQIQDILNNRRAEALRSMEDERQRHIQARTKPSKRIGVIANPMLGSAAEEEVDAEERHEQYLLAKDTKYRVDDMGMDTAWRDYRVNDLQLVQSARKQALPKFRVERPRKAQSVGPHAPVATELAETLRPQNFARQVPLRQIEMAAPHSAR